MNERCKQYLVHSWGKAPERKHLEKIYNAGYYQRNRDKILKRAKERGQIKRGPASHDIATAPLYLYEDSAEFFSYSDKAFKSIKNAMRKTISSIKKIPSYIKTGKDFVSEIKNTMKKPIDVLKNSSVVKAIKNVFGKFKYYWHSATI